MAVSDARLSERSRRIERSAHRAALGKRLVLAVSGGRDSMALLHAMARTAPDSIAVVATFDHGTGPAATAAAQLVSRDAHRLGFDVAMGRAERPGTSEAEWRYARRTFLFGVARAVGGTVATAHTRDDQVETVLMRLMRDAGARGIAGLYAGTNVVRPWIECSREDVAAFAVEIGVTWMDDPTNASMRLLRNRVRRDLLPALRRADRDIERALLRSARLASGWRRRVDGIAAGLSVVEDLCSASIPVSAVARLSASELAVLWPAVASRVGLAMDRRGTERAAEFTTQSQAGARIQLSGGWEIWRSRDRLELRRDRPEPVPVRRALQPDLRWGEWRFVATRAASEVSDAWVAQLPTSGITVRGWQPGDRMRLSNGSLRKVKRFLSDAHVSGARRGQWPVVLAGDEIVWIPGVRRSDAAAVRPGRPGVLYRCELEHN